MKKIKLLFFVTVILVITFMPCSKTYGQEDWYRWEAKEFSYLINNSASEETASKEKSANVILLSFKNIYKFFISDLDGDNCPFTPSCSSFFVQAVSETNFFMGALLFADRFMRDSNPFKIHKHYPIKRNKKFYDPVKKYLF